MRRCVARAVWVVLVLSAAVSAHAQTAEEIVARNLAAKGGAEKWKSLTSVKLTGKISIQGKEVPLTILSMRPNLKRQEMTLGEMKIVQGFDGTRAWVSGPMTGGAGKELPPEAAELMKTNSDFETPLMDYKAKGNTVEYVGVEKVDGRQLQHVKVTLKGGQVQDYYFDPKTGLEARITQQVDVPGGQKQTLTSEMSDYRDAGGIPMPHTMTQLLDGKVVGRMVLEQVEFNTITDDAVFKMPGSAPPAK